MKTFTWTIPEPLPSAVEERQWRLIADIDLDAPTKRELKEFEKWEKVRKKGLRAFIIRFVATLIIIAIILCFLEAFDIFRVSEASIPAMIGGPIGSLIGLLISWNKYKDNRQRIEDYLKTKS